MPKAVMTLSRINKRTDALTKIELLVIVASIAALICLVMPALIRAQQRAKSICCNCNLKQISLAFRLWENDHKNLFPMSVSTNFGGTQEYLFTGQTFRHFQILSNELSTPVILVCPRDYRRATTDFGSNFLNTSVSYFVGLVMNSDNPGMFLAGDRNIVGGKNLGNGIIEITTNDAISWGTDLHNSSGNLAFADGSVQQLGTKNLRQALQSTGIGTNRLAIP
jgi:prepilin-type processing-associated H-X9-DG protein